jgi:MerR family copper efflux transcriptional regulator
MDGLTIHQAAQTTGWSARMLRYIDSAGLVTASRTESGYRIYGPAELQRLRTLRQLLGQFDLTLTDIGFAQRMRTDPTLADAVQRWLTAEPSRPTEVPDADWLRWEQDKHQRLLAESSNVPSHDSVKETA